MNSPNEWADFWRLRIGVNVISADTKNKITYEKWSNWQDSPIPEELHNQWKEQNSFSKGIAIIPGKVWHREDKNGLFLIVIDLDKLTAIQEVCTNGNGKSISLQEMSQKFIVEQHKDDLDKAHVYFYSPRPFPKKSADSGRGLEVKSLGIHGIAYCSPSIHKQGQPYEIIGTSEPETLTIEQAKEFIQQIDNICKKYGIVYLEKHHKNLLDSNSKIYEGSRHDSLIRIANSLLFRYGDDAKTEQQDLKDFFVDINNKRCEPPLSINELNSIWKDAVSYYVTKKEQEKEGERRKNHHGKQSKEEQQESYAEILVQLARDNTELFFKDQYGTAFALVKINNDDDDQHGEVIRLESNKFKRYLSKLFYDNQNRRVVNSDAINNAVQVLEAKTEYEGQTIPLSLRVASKKENNNNEDNSLTTTIYYDLTNPKWQYIKITNHQWELVDNNNNNSNIPPATLFVRYNQVPQVLPDRNYEPDVFDKFLTLTNINDEQNRLLLKVYIVSLFIPDIAHVILILHGEKGSAKSTLQQLIKLLVDPAKPTLLTIHKDRNEFVQQLNHNHLAFYDNVKHVPYWLSDEACKAVTGIGQTKRKLYSDDDDVVYEYKRCLGFNGINISLIEPDALDRSILIELNRITKEDRKLESDILAVFGNIRSKLLGYIFDTIVKSLPIKPSISLLDLPRMADFAVWGEAIARAMGCRPMEFINAYNENIGRQNIEAIESNPLAQTIDKFVDSWYNEKGEITFWEGSTKEALEQLNRLAQLYKIDTDSKLWPKATNSLTRKLRPILSNLREGLGIQVIIGRNTGSDDKNKKNTSTIRIEKISPPPPLSPPDQNQAQNQGKSSGGILDSGGIISTQHQISPPENSQNRAQKTESGDSGHSGGIIPTLEEKNHYDTAVNNLLERYVAFDLEWTTAEFVSANSTPIKIIAAAFVDNQEKSKVLHVSDYSNSDSSEYELLVDINKNLSKYDYSLGWYSTGVAKYHEDTQEYLDGVDSDLAILHNRCVANDIDSIVDFNNAGIPYIRGQTHIDLYNVFGKPMVQTTIFKNAYRTLKLDEVSKAVLGDSSLKTSGGKYKGLTGKYIQTLAIEEQKKYVLRDAELVMQLSKYNNSEVLDAMKSISEITGLNFERVCRTGISTWWASIFDNMVSNEECQALVNRKGEQHELELELEYIGGHVIQPKKGFYHNLIVVDVASLYPTMAILYNISFDTVNCQCCKDNLISNVDKGITKDCKIQKEYWICRQKHGAFPKKLKIFKDERLKQKNLGNQVKQLALKILINGGYGVFGSRYFKYRDLRVAELITAYGRYTLSKMQEIAKDMGFEIVYGDTDSLFLYYNTTAYGSTATNPSNDIISRFQEECNRQLGVEVEHAKIYTTAIISDKKKHYVGWSGIQGKEPDIVGMEGDKNDRPKWINTVFRQTVDDIVVNNTNPIPNLKQAVFDLESGNVNPELLKRSSRLSKNPEEYENENDRKRKIGLVVGARKGDIIEYFESDSKEGYSLNSQDISIKRYKLMLWKAVKDILEIAAYDIATIEHELVLNDNNMATQQSLQVAWPGKANLQTGGDLI